MHLNALRCGNQLWSTHASTSICLLESQSTFFGVFQFCPVFVDRSFGSDSKLQDPQSICPQVFYRRRARGTGGLGPVSWDRTLTVYYILYNPYITPTWVASMFAYIYIYINISLSLCLSSYLSVYLSIYLSTYLSIYLSIDRSIVFLYTPMGLARQCSARHFLHKIASCLIFK